MKRIPIATILLLLETCYALHIHHCPVSSCGNIPNISYPFRLKSDPLGCGDNRYQLDCENNATVLTLFSGKYNVQHIDYKRYKIRVSDVGIVEHTPCSFMPQYFLYSGNFTQFFIGPGPDLLSLEQFLVSIAYFNCTNPITDDSRYVDVNATGCGFGGHIYAVVKDSSNDFGVKDIRVGCEMKVATLANWGTLKDHKTHKNVSQVDIRNMLSRGFGLSWLNVICEDLCGEGKGCHVVNESTGEVQCDDQSQDCRYFYTANQVTYQCGGTGVDIVATIIGLFCIGVYKGLVKIFGLNKAVDYDGIEVEIGKGTGRYVLPYFIVRFFIGVVAFIALLIYKWARRHTSNYENIEDFLQGNTLMPLRYSYKEIKHMTRNFKEKLGQGGFGSVYKGKLRSGSFVAVKMLKRSKDNGQEFISEVATIGRIHHTNIVRLIGFSVEASKCALIYEFMPNCSLNKYIFSKTNDISLTYKQIYEISLGVAYGIAYLHQGCDMQILHFISNHITSFLMRTLSQKFLTLALQSFIL